MQILYGTTNGAKLTAMRGVTDCLGVTLMSLQDVPAPLPLIDESGMDPLENARIKAMAYYRAFGVPVFSCDSGLFFDEVPPEQQPGVHVRRVNGRELTDEEMVAYYAALAQRHGGRLTARYRNAICFVYDIDHVYSSFDLSLATDAFYMVDKPFDKVREAGFPLDSLSVDISTGKYYYDQPQCTLGVSGTIMDGFTDFWKTVLLQLSEM